MLVELGVQHVTVAGSGSAALSILEKETFDLSWLIFKWQKFWNHFMWNDSEKATSWCPIIVGLTAETSKAVDAMCIDSSMSRVLHKPVTQDELYDFLRPLLSCFLLWNKETGLRYEHHATLATASWQGDILSTNGCSKHSSPSPIIWNWIVSCMSWKLNTLLYLRSGSQRILQFCKILQ